MKNAVSCEVNRMLFCWEVVEEGISWYNKHGIQKSVVDNV